MNKYQEVMTFRIIKINDVNGNEYFVVHVKSAVSKIVKVTAIILVIAVGIAWYTRNVTAIFGTLALCVLMAAVLPEHSGWKAFSNSFGKIKIVQAGSVLETRYIGQSYARQDIDKYVLDLKREKQHPPKEKRTNVWEWDYK